MLLINQKRLFHSGMIFWFLKENSILEIFGFVDVEIGLKSPLTSVLKHPGSWFCTEDPGYSRRFLQMIFPTFVFNSEKKTQYIQGFFLLGAIIEIFISSNLQRRPKVASKWENIFIALYQVGHRFLQVLSHFRGFEPHLRRFFFLKSDIKLAFLYILI